MPLALLPPWSSNFLPLERPTEVQCCAPGSQGEARERLPADERGGGGGICPIAGFWSDPGHAANQREDVGDQEAHRNRIRTMIPNMLTFRQVRIL